MSHITKYETAHGTSYITRVVDAGDGDVDLTVIWWKRGRKHTTHHHTTIRLSIGHFAAIVDRVREVADEQRELARRRRNALGFRQ